MDFVDDIAALEALYPRSVNKISVDKVHRSVTPLYRQWLETAKFCILSTVGPDGTDASPRGDDGPVVKILDEQTLAMPDWRGNNRLDSLRNIVVDPRASLLFMIPGQGIVVRVNGKARLTADAGLRAQFDRAGKLPATVIVLHIEELYYQCSKAILRSNLWSGEDEFVRVPTAGEFIKDFDAGFDAVGYDDGYLDYAKPRFW